MITSIAILRAKTISLLGCMTLLAASAVSAHAQKPEARILTPIDNTARTTLAGSRPPVAQVANDAGRMSGTAPFEAVSITLSRSVAQQSALEALIAAQQDPASPQYHQWLTPDQFAAEFGAADSDLAQVQAWLQARGFTDVAVSRNRSEITFSGNVSQIEAAFGTEMHYFKSGGQTHFAPASDLSVPAAMAPAILSITRLSDFRPKSHFIRGNPALSRPNFTSGQTGSHFMTPGDLGVIYDINAAYNAGYTGAGQTIAVIGQSTVVTGDILNFQTAAGVPVRAPTLVPVPTTGSYQVSDGDEEESDLDLEYTSSIARGATIYFVYTGNSLTTGGAFAALQYAVQTPLPGQSRPANIISSSYGDCEPDVGAAEFATLNTYLAQAAAQGQTVMSAAGDSGSSDCYNLSDFNSTSITTPQVAAPSVDFPASSQYVTAMGGSEFPTADVASTNTTYWKASTGSDLVTSALSYIPEQVWNDDAVTSGLSAGGGGVSIFAPAPSWQTGVPGITANTFRTLPDLALDASPNNAGYLICSSDPSSGITGSCSYGFRDSSDLYLTVAGGTSFATPIFAGMQAIINQSKGATTGSGLINPTLYKLASNAATYASAFHDIQTGNNECVLNAVYPLEFYTNGTVELNGPACPSAAATSYAAGVGYDEASGLGSVDLNNLITAWPGTSVTSVAKFTLSAPAATVAAAASGTDTVTVTPSNGYTGTVAFTVTTSPLISGACYTAPNATVGATAATASVTIYTSSTLCPTGAVALLQTGVGKQAMTTIPVQPGQSDSRKELPAGIAVAGLLALGLVGRRSRRLRGLVLVALLAVAGFGISGCGSSSTAGAGITGGGGTTTTTTSAAAGTYTVTVTGEDTTSGQQATTTFSLTIQ